MPSGNVEWTQSLRIDSDSASVPISRNIDLVIRNSYYKWQRYAEPQSLRFFSRGLLHHVVAVM